MTRRGIQRWRASVAWCACAGICLLGSASPARANDAALTADAIVERVLARNAFGFENAIARVALSTQSKSGGEKSRLVEIRSLRRDALTKTVTRFLGPADVAGTAFLVRQNADREDDQYLYLPALGKLKRITLSQRQQRFMGTEFSYADLESDSLRKAQVRRMPDQTLGNDTVYVIEAVPQAAKESEYARTVSYVHPTAFVPLRMEFFDKKGALLKLMTVAALEQRDGHWLVRDATLVNVQTEGKTRILVQSVDFSAALQEREFTEQALLGG